MADNWASMDYLMASKKNGHFSHGGFNASCRERRQQDGQFVFLQNGATHALIVCHRYFMLEKRKNCNVIG